MDHIFISYSRKDQEYARQLADFLEQNGFNIWIDDQVDYGDRWERVIFKAIEDCAALILIMTPDSYDSVWVEREYIYAQDQNSKPVFPVLLAGKVFPRYVTIQYVDVRDGNLPPQGFIDRLDKVVSRQASKGENVAESLTQSSVVGEGLKPSPTIIYDPISLQELTDITRQILGDPFEWIEIPEGEFIYGEGETQQKLFLPTYAIAKYPITYSQFQKFINDKHGIGDNRWWEGLAEQYKKPFEQQWKIADHPRENVNWYQAIAFCRWLSHQLWDVVGARRASPLQEDYDPMNPFIWLVRLPTEQEWEKAARGTDGREFPWGNEFDSQKANTSQSGLKKTTPVTTYPEGASPYGVLDMSGNIWEWCLTEGDGQNNSISNYSHILRGGSWHYGQYSARTVSRAYNNKPYLWDNKISFRAMCGICSPE